MADSKFNKQYLSAIRDAYNKAPYVGVARGVLKGLPFGAVAGGLTYGALSLVPATRKKKVLTAISSILAAAAADASVAIPAVNEERDTYFKNKTDLPSPWKTYEFKREKGGTVKVNPSETLGRIQDEWDNTINKVDSAWNKFKSSPAAYIASGIK